MSRLPRTEQDGKTGDPPKKGWFKRFFYELVRVSAWCAFRLLFRLRVEGLDNIPQRGPVLLCPNHQSHLDPPLVGCVSRRRMNFLAKKQLFYFPPLRWLISFLDSIPIDREGMSAGGLKETLKRLRRNEMVLFFPEGTRTPDGEMKKTLPGFVAVVKRSGAAVVPIGIQGAYEVWPRHRWFPVPGRRIALVIGTPIQPEVYSPMEDRDLVELLDGRIRECMSRAGELRIARRS